jgi:hypothetical protein
MCRCFLAILFVVVVPQVVGASDSMLLYGETFDSVSSPTFSTSFGSLGIAQAASPFPTKSLEFNTQGSPGSFFYDQIQFRVDYVNSPYLGIPHRRFHVGFDFFTKQLIGTPNHFSVLLDTPGSKAIRFEGSGDVVIQNLGFTESSHFSDLQPMHVDMVLDLNQQRLSVAIDGQQIYSAASNPEKLQSVRFSLGAQSSGVVDHAAYVYVDNISISAMVPEPSSVSLAATTMIGCLAGGRRLSYSSRWRQLTCKSFNANACESSCGRNERSKPRLFSRR